MWIVTVGVLAGIKAFVKGGFRGLAQAWFPWGMICSIVVWPVQLFALRQDSATVRSVVSCNTCRISVIKVVSIGDSESENGFVPSLANGLGVGSDGTLWVSYEMAGELPARYDLHGNFLGRVGRSGKGPGEFQGPVVARSFGTDTVFLLDYRAQRLSAYVPPQLEPVRTSRIQGPIGNLEFLVLNNGYLVTNAHSPDPTFSGTPIHIYDSSGEHLRSVGGGLVMRYGDRKSSLRKLARVPHGLGFWTVDMDVNLREWTSDGAHIRTLTRAAEWRVPASTGVWIPQREDPPPHQVIAIAPTEDGFLWLVAAVAAPTWERAIRRRGLPFMGSDFDVTDVNELFDTVIEVIDPSNASLVASVTLDEVVVSFSPPYMLTAGDNFEDNPMLNLWRVRAIHCHFSQ